MARVQLFHRIDARCEVIVKQGLFIVRRSLAKLLQSTVMATNKSNYYCHYMPSSCVRVHTAPAATIVTQLYSLIRCHAYIYSGSNDSDNTSESARLFHQEVISLVRTGGLHMESQAGRSVGYRQALEYLKTQWGFPHLSDDGKEVKGHVYVAQVRGICVENNILI